MQSDLVHVQGEGLVVHDWLSKLMGEHCQDTAGLIHRCTNDARRQYTIFVSARHCICEALGLVDIVNWGSDVLP